MDAAGVPLFASGGYFSANFYSQLNGKRVEPVSRYPNLAAIQYRSASFAMLCNIDNANFRVA